MFSRETVKGQRFEKHLARHKKKGSDLLSQIGSKKILATCYSPAPK